MIMEGIDLKGHRSEGKSDILMLSDVELKNDSIIRYMDFSGRLAFDGEHQVADEYFRI